MGVSWAAIEQLILGANPSLWESREFWLTIALMTGVLLLGAVALVLVDRWRKSYAQSRPLSGDQLSHFQVLYEQGELSREEFDRVRTLLGKRLRQDLEAPPSSPAAEAIRRPVDLTRWNNAGAKESPPSAAEGIQPPPSPQPGDPAA